MQKEFNKIKPYVYWMKNNITGIKYFGVRWKNVRLKKTPIQDFGKTYFSSGLLEKDFKKNPNNFINIFNNFLLNLLMVRDYVVLFLRSIFQLIC